MDRLGECDLWSDDWRILEPDLGSNLRFAIEKTNEFEKEFQYNPYFTKKE